MEIGFFFHVISCNVIILAFRCRFLTKNFTVDLPRLFVRPNKIVLDFQKGKVVGPVTVGPVADGVKDGEMQEGNMDSVGELSVTLVDAREASLSFW